EVVLHDPEMVAVVVDVGGKLGAVAPAHHALLAARRGLPVHFQLQLVRLDEARRIGEPLAELAQEEQEAVGLGLVVAQGGVGGGPGAARDRRSRSCSSRSSAASAGPATPSSAPSRARYGGTAAGPSTAGHGRRAGAAPARPTTRSGIWRSACARCPPFPCRGCPASPGG